MIVFTMLQRVIRAGPDIKMHEIFIQSVEIGLLMFCVVFFLTGLSFCNNGILVRSDCFDDEAFAGPQVT